MKYMTNWEARETTKSFKTLTYQTLILVDFQVSGPPVCRGLFTLRPIRDGRFRVKNRQFWAKML